MAPITNLFTKCSTAFYQGIDLPILVMMHGWNQDAAGAPNIDMQRLADYGFFVVVPGMRARDSAGGTKDGGAREIYDIIDVVNWVRVYSPWKYWVSQTKAALVGYSGGGGNGFSCACKFPDFFNVIVSYFGMSDYGRDGTDGWYQNNGGGIYTASIGTAIGGTPAAVPDNYYARDATAAIQNYSGGFLYLYHDKQDASVPWVHSNRIKTALDNAFLTNYSANFSDVGDAVRWYHGYPNDNPGTLSTAEPTWTAKIKSQAVWTIPASGTVTVIGYIITKRFTIWLNAGLDAAATVVYDTAAGTYTVTPLTSNPVIAVTITQGVLTASGNTAGPTLFTVA